MIREDGSGEVVVGDLMEIPVNSGAEMLNVIDTGMGPSATTQYSVLHV